MKKLLTLLPECLALVALFFVALTFGALLAAEEWYWRRKAGGSGNDAEGEP